MGKRKSFLKSFSENSDRKQALLAEYEEDFKEGERRKRIRTREDLAKVVKEFDLSVLVSSKMDINEIHYALQQASEHQPIEKLELVVTLKTSGEVDECSVPMGYSIQMIADGVHIHTVFCMNALESGLVSAVATRRRKNAISRCKVFAEYLKLLIEEIAHLGSEPWLPKSFELSEDIQLSEALLDHTKFTMD